MSENNGVAWEDLAVLLAVLRHRSLASAARVLAISVSTASRRMTRLETVLDAHLFDRTPEGMMPTALALELAPHAEVIEAQMRVLHRVRSRRELAPTGRVSVAMPDGLASAWLVPRLSEFYQAYSGLSLDLVIGHGVVDLVRGEADMALRFVRPTSPDLVCQRLGDLPMAPYVHASLAAQDPTQLRWIVFNDPEQRYLESRWVSTHIAPEHTMRVSLWNALFASVVHGLGPGLLSPIVADPAGLVRIQGYPPVDSRSLYLVYHRALRDVPRIAAVRRWVQAMSSQLTS